MANILISDLNYDFEDYLSTLSEEEILITGGDGDQGCGSGNSDDDSCGQDAIKNYVRGYLYSPIYDQNIANNYWI